MINFLAIPPNPYPAFYFIYYINDFNRKWISLVCDKIKEDATILISGTMHNIFSVGQIGFSKAAINRAYFDPIDIKLEVLNFKDLHQFQGFESITYSGKHGVFLPAPFGWIIDATKRSNMLASLYQRGLTLEQAGESKEWMYVNIISKNDKIKTLDDFLKYQEKYILNDFPNAKIDFLPTVKQNNAKIKLRSIDIDTYPTKEYTGFIEFAGFIFFCVLFTPEELKKKNIKKLENVNAIASANSKSFN